MLSWISLFFRTAGRGREPARKRDPLSPFALSRVLEVAVPSRAHPRWIQRNRLGNSKGQGPGVQACFGHRMRMISADGDEITCLIYLRLVGSSVVVCRSCSFPASILAKGAGEAHIDFITNRCRFSVGARSGALQWPKQADRRPHGKQAKSHKKQKRKGHDFSMSAVSCADIP